MHDDQLAAIDDWVEKQGTRISRSEAIRRLVEIGLKAKEMTVVGLEELAEVAVQLESTARASFQRVRSATRLSELKAKK
jgi:Arc/MetJ-type ribon-helix-helix transcriptional regulator